MSKRKVQGKLDNFFAKRQALEAVADEQTAADDEENVVHSSFGDSIPTESGSST